jgi:hypothetical protein
MVALYFAKRLFYELIVVIAPVAFCYIMLVFFGGDASSYDVI